MTARRTVLLDAGTSSVDAREVGGIGLRVCELAETLAQHHDVTVVAEPCDDPVPVGGARLVGPEQWRRAVAQADVVMFFDGSSTERLDDARRSGALVVVENAPPIEQLEYPSVRRSPDPVATHRAILDTYAAQLAAGDHFLCRSRIERITLVANLCLAGRLRGDDIDTSRTLEHRVSVVPIGYGASAAASADALPRTLGPDLLWTGGLWSYFDPLALVEALAVARDQGQVITTCFMYGKPGTDTAQTLRALHAEVAEKGLNSSVTILDDPPSHHERDRLIRSAGALVAIARPGIENDTCVRLRIRDSRLHGIPLVCDGFGATAVEAVADGIGVPVDPRDPIEFARRLTDLRTTGNPRNGRERLAPYCYDQSIGGFVEWLGRATHESVRRAG